MDRIIREPECRQLTGLSRTTRWELERLGLFPPRRRLSANTIGWLESELLAWIRTRETSSGCRLMRVTTARLRTRDTTRKHAAVSGETPSLGPRE